jgi:hypothetical protein
MTGGDRSVRYRVCNGTSWSTWVVAVEDTGWVDLRGALASGGTGTCEYRCHNGVVEVRIALSGITAITVNTSRTIVNGNALPAAYRPGKAAIYQAGSAAGSGMSLGVINVPNGDISLWNPSYNTGSLTVARVTFTYLKET